MHGYGNFAIVPVSDTKPNPWHLENLPSSIGPTELKALISLRSISSLLSFSASASVRRSRSHFSFFIFPSPMSAGYSPYLECVTHISKPYPYRFRWSPTPSHRSPIFLPRLCRLSTLELLLPLPDHMSLRLSLSLPCLAFVLNWNCKSQFFFSFFVFLPTCSVAWASALLPLGP